VIGLLELSGHPRCNRHGAGTAAVHTKPRSAGEGGGSLKP
jgi:hypothetical protein